MWDAAWSPSQPSGGDRCVDIRGALTEFISLGSTEQEAWWFPKRVCSGARGYALKCSLSSGAAGMQPAHQEAPRRHWSCGVLQPGLQVRLEDLDTLHLGALLTSAPVRCLLCPPGAGLVCWVLGVFAVSSPLPGTQRAVGEVHASWQNNKDKPQGRQRPPAALCPWLK